MDFKILKYISVSPVQVNLIRKDGGRQVAEAFFEKLNLQQEVLALVVGIRAVVVDERIALEYACTYLGTEFSPCLGLSTDNGTDVWLKDAQYAVCTSMSL